MRGKRRDLDCDPAVRWLLRFVEGDVSTLSSEERAEWERWSSEPRNLERFQRAERLWRSLELIPRESVRPSRAELERDEYDGSIPVSEWLAQTR